MGMWGGQWGQTMGWAVGADSGVGSGGRQWGGHVWWAVGGTNDPPLLVTFFESWVKGVSFSREQRIAHRLSADPIK